MAALVYKKKIVNVVVHLCIVHRWEKYVELKETIKTKKIRENRMEFYLHIILQSLISS